MGLEIDWGVLLSDLGTALAESGLMIGISLAFAVLVGIPLGVLLFVTRKELFWRNAVVNVSGGTFVNFVRSLPFVILLILVLPLAKMVTGRTTGPVAASVPLTIAVVVFYARLVEGALCEVPKGVIEAGHAMGASPLFLIRNVLLAEALPGLIRGFTVTTISLIGFLAINYGYYRYETPVMVATVVVIVLIVQAIQSAGDAWAKKADRG